MENLTIFFLQGEVHSWASKSAMANGKIIPAICFPFHSILFAIGNPSVDYFSLDIEGVELAVLKTIPWNKVDIKVNKSLKHSLGT